MQKTKLAKYLKFAYITPRNEEPCESMALRFYNFNQ